MGRKSYCSYTGKRSHFCRLLETPIKAGLSLGSRNSKSTVFCEHRNFIFCTDAAVAFNMSYEFAPCRLLQSQIHILPLTMLKAKNQPLNYRRLSSEFLTQYVNLPLAVTFLYTKLEGFRLSDKLSFKGK